MKLLALRKPVDYDLVHFGEEKKKAEASVYGFVFGKKHPIF